MVPALPMFPLGSVLFPFMPLRLRVFEERYLMMLAELLKTESAQFGVVLIERGREVGGGEQRFGGGHRSPRSPSSGPRRASSGWWPRAGGGSRSSAGWRTRRIRGPRSASCPTWSGTPSLAELRADTERLVRRTLAVASEFAENVWPADIELSDDPVAAAWQLAAIAPLGALDQVELLPADSLERLLTRVGELTAEAGRGLRGAVADRGRPGPSRVRPAGRTRSSTGRQPDRQHHAGGAAASGSISSRPTSCPRRRIDCCTVVRFGLSGGGDVVEAADRHVGGHRDSPRSVKTESAPRAITSLSPTTAVGSGPDSTRWLAALAPDA